MTSPMARGARAPLHPEPATTKPPSNVLTDPGQFGILLSGPAGQGRSRSADAQEGCRYAARTPVCCRCDGIVAFLDIALSRPSGIQQLRRRRGSDGATLAPCAME